MSGVDEEPFDNPGKPSVKDYMTREVATVSPDASVGEVKRRIAETGHDGFPVCDGRRVEGFVTARDLLLADDAEPVFTLMSQELIVAHPDMSVTDAARVILRSGIQKLPVVDDAGNLVGIISNADVVRSQIERATPEKVGKLMRTLESIHDIEVEQTRRTVTLADLVPTQSKVYADEL
ncbi:MAG: CBS domain-containing protein, partial [Halobacteriales archaeon]